MNVEITEHNKNMFKNTLGETFKFVAQDVQLYTCPIHFQLLDLLNQTSRLHHELFLKRHMLVELCVGNYHTLNGLVNNVNETFEKNIQKMFQNLGYGSISIIFTFGSTLGLKIHTYIENYLHLTRIERQLNRRLKYK
jgi:hypothetical protein